MLFLNQFYLTVQARPPSLELLAIGTGAETFFDTELARNMATCSHLPKRLKDSEALS